MEIRDNDANIYVRACTRGHTGSITSVHANELEDVPEAITDMCMLDGRGMNPDRLVKRIAEYVTQIGFEMALIDGKRKLVRIGEYEFIGDQVRVRDWVRYHVVHGTWEYPCNYSSRARSRMSRYDPDGFHKLTEAELVKSC